MERVVPILSEWLVVEIETSMRPFEGEQSHITFEYRGNRVRSNVEYCGFELQDKGRRPAYHGQVWGTLVIEFLRPWCEEDGDWQGMTGTMIKDRLRVPVRDWNVSESPHDGRLTIRIYVEQIRGTRVSDTNHERTRILQRT